MNRKMIISAGMLLLATAGIIPAQTSFTLKGCLDYAFTNNRSIRMADYDLEISQKKKVEQIGNYLPQVNVSGSVDDNLELAKYLLPAEMMGGEPGTYIPVTFGTKYATTGTVQVTQKIVDPVSWLNIRSSGKSGELSAQNLQKTREDVIYNISTVYYQTLVVKKQAELLKTILLASEESVKSTELRFRNGLAKQIDIDKLRVSYNNTLAQVQQTDLRYAQLLNSLKYNLGMPVDSVLELADTSLTAVSLLFENRPGHLLRVSEIIDYQIRETSYSLTEYEKKKAAAVFYPVLSFYGNYGYNAWRQEFNFFDPDKEWYNSSAIGLKLSIPIFDGLQRSSRLSQSKLNLEKARENLWQTEQYIKVNASNYNMRYLNAMENIHRERENLKLAESVYRNTQLELRQGAGSTLDLIQAESSYVQAQNNYFSKLLDLYVARLDLERASGTLPSFIQQL